MIQIDENNKATLICDANDKLEEINFGEYNFKLLDLSDYGYNIRLLNLKNAKIDTLILPTRQLDVLPEKFLFGADIKNIVFPETLQSVLCQSLSETTLKKIDFKGTDLKRIGPSAFEFSEDLEEIIFPKGKISLSASAFKGCKSLKKIDTENISILNDFAFSDCKSLKTATINGVLGNYVFKNCTSLKTICFSENFSIAEDFAISTSFTDCKNIKNVYIDKKIQDKILKEHLDYLCKNILYVEPVYFDTQLDIIILENKSFKEINNAYKEKSKDISK